MRRNISRDRVARGHAVPSILIALTAGCMDAADDDAATRVDDTTQADQDNERWTSAKAWAANETNDRFGESIASGDFDDDGYGDIAVGAPSEAPGAEPVSGAVFIFRGSSTGLSPWRVLTQETRPVRSDGGLDPVLATNAHGDEFGRSLTVGDFNDDGVSDLAVGIPGKRVGAGAVMMFTGHRALAGDARSVLVASAVIDEANLGVGAANHERFGDRLVALDIDGAGADELAVAATGEAGAGAVLIVRGGAAGFQHAQTVTAASAGGTVVAGQQFGLALARGAFSSSRYDDLVVGAPGHTEDGSVAAGAIAVFRGGASTLIGVHWQAGEPGIGPTSNARFGEAVAVGDLAFEEPGGNIVAGAPGHDDGVVYAYRMDRQSLPVYWNHLRAPLAGYPEATAGFGASMLIGRISSNRRAELLVGAPRGSAGGRAFLLGLDRWGTFAVIAATRLGTVEAGGSDGFASSLATATVDGASKRVLVTAPATDDGNVRDTGAVYQFQVGSGQLLEERRIWQRP